MSFRNMYVMFKPWQCSDVNIHQEMRVGCDDVQAAVDDGSWWGVVKSFAHHNRVGSKILPKGIEQWAAQSSPQKKFKNHRLWYGPSVLIASSGFALDEVIMNINNKTCQVINWPPLPYCRIAEQQYYCRHKQCYWRRSETAVLYSSYRNCSVIRVVAEQQY